MTNVNTSTSTATSTNTSTNTNTTTSTVTQTFGTDADGDGLLQASELNADGSGSDFLFTDSTESIGGFTGENANGYYDLVIDQEITQEIILGDVDLGMIDYENGSSGNYTGANGQRLLVDIIQEIPLMNDTVNADGTITYTGDTPPNPSVDDNGATDLGGNITVVEVLADGFVTIQQDFVQQIDQDIIQDVFYETDLVQDIVQEVGINQTYTVDVLKTETRTRLVGE
jgi:hypothetical protein